MESTTTGESMKSRGVGWLGLLRGFMLALAGIVATSSTASNRPEQVEGLGGEPRYSLKRFAGTWGVDSYCSRAASRWSLNSRSSPGGRTELAWSGIGSRPAVNALAADSHSFQIYHSGRCMMIFAADLIGISACRIRRQKAVKSLTTGRAFRRNATRATMESANTRRI